MRSTERLVWPEGGIVPRAGDLARVLKDVTLDGGGTLPANQNVLVEYVLEDVPTVVGIKWRDADGTHVMAINVGALEVIV